MAMRDLLAATLGLAWLWPASAGAQDKPAADNGTDPTKFQTVALARYEYLDLAGGFGSGTLRLVYSRPIGDKRDYMWEVTVPVTAVDVYGDDGYDLGDVALKVQHVFGLSRTGAYVVKGEMNFDTAARPELGTGKDVFKGTFIYARFLKNKAIFAPAVVQSVSVGGDAARADVNLTTFDFYYVPRLKDPRNLVTFDPSLNFDWENDKQFFGLAVTVGRVVGPAFGGNAVVFVKPSIFAGGDRPGDWGIEVGYKVLGF
ncbi:MAG TPA: hypothetical protein VN205_13175 [Thermomonas sp.]|nr:hypothetical protein [Thermomonas sp.]